jgi:Bardet-Biedl syndrome 9 protein
MSLFKAREWWSTKVDGGEELDGSCMALGNVDNEADGSDKIVLGGFSGNVRIYKPSGRGFKPNDVKCEQQLGAPVLQVRPAARRMSLGCH